MRLDFPEGVLECAYNSSNLPVVTVQPPAELEADLKAMNSCVTMEANQNLSVAQKELLKWHCKLGHLDFKQIQNLMRSGGADSRAESFHGPFHCNHPWKAVPKQRE